MREKNFLTFRFLFAIMCYEKIEEVAMIVTKRNIFTGQERSLDLAVTQEQLNRWNNGELIQKVFPHLSVDEREFLMTGIIGEEWNELTEELARDEFVYEL